MVEQASVARAALVVAVAALLEAVVGPYLTFGPFSPKLVLISVVFSVSLLQDLQAVLLGFFGGILLDALGGGLFGAGALGGLVAGALSVRFGGAQRGGGARPVLAQVVALSVVAYDLVGLLARKLAGLSGPAFGEYALVGALPDAVLNAALAFLVGGLLLRAVRTKPYDREER